MADFQTRSDEGTLILQFTRAPVNALGPDMLEALDTLFDNLLESPPPGGLVVSGLEKSFCAGIDTKALAAFTPEEKTKALARIDSIMAKLYSLPVPTVAAVQGHAIGAGFIIALACDWKYLALAPGKLGLNQVAVGIQYPPVPIRIVKTEIPEPYLRRLTLGGALMSAEEVGALGLFDEICSPEDLSGKAVGQAKKLAAHPGFADVKAQVRGQTAAALRALAGLSE